MHSAAVQMEAAQLGLVQRTQKYQDAAALRLIDDSGAAGQGQVQSVAPPPRSPPIEPVSASPREGSTTHVIA
jgi:hypothetical protein